MNYNMIIGSNIRFERKKRDLTIEEFARVIGMAPGFVGLIERGQRGTSMANLVKITEFFEISLDDLITKDISSSGKVSSPKASTKADKDRKALISMIGSMSDAKVQILTSNAKALNKYMDDAELSDDE